jgi:hypothetical protein
MPQGRPQTPVNKEALNALVDLYYLYSDLATHIRESSESPQELDLFFSRPGGLKELLQKYYVLALLNPEEAGSHVGALTLELMLPRDNSVSFYRAHDELWKQIVDVNSDLKGYNRNQGAIGTPVPQEVMEAVNEGRHIIARRNQRGRSIADAATVDLVSAVVAYEGHVLKIDAVELPFRTNTLGDLVLEYMFQRRQKGERVNIDDVANWVISTTGDEGFRSRGVKDKCRDINAILQDKLVTALELFDTTESGHIKRNY